MVGPRVQMWESDEEEMGAAVSSEKRGGGCTLLKKIGSGLGIFFVVFSSVSKISPPFASVGNQYL